MKNIGYIRVSTDGQDNSVLTQREMIENYSKLKGIEIHDYFIDFGISGKNTIKREKYLELIRLVEDGQINIIITKFNWCSNIQFVEPSKIKIHIMNISGK